MQTYSMVDPYVKWFPKSPKLKILSDLGPDSPNILKDKILLNWHFLIIFLLKKKDKNVLHSQKPFFRIFINFRRFLWILPQILMMWIWQVKMLPDEWCSKGILHWKGYFTSGKMNVYLKWVIYEEEMWNYFWIWSFLGSEKLMWMKDNNSQNALASLP